MRAGVSVLATAGLLAGCAEGNSIYHSRALSPTGDRIVTIDAKQRNVLVTRDAEGAWRMCAEAAPDVFSALSASASLGVDVTTRSGRAAAAIAEAAGTVERTQTVNLLRESMYRTCERYLDGAIGRAQLVVQAARDQRAMVKILAIEQLTRVARGPATIVAPPSTAAATVDGDAVAGLVGDLARERTAARTALDAAAAAYAAALKKGRCDVVATAPADDGGDPKLSDWTACRAAGAERDARQAALDASTARFDKALAAAGQLGSQSSATTGGGASSGGGGGAAPSDAGLASVAGAVERIANSPDIDEPLMFCIALLAPPPPGGQGSARGVQPPDPATSSTCLGILRDRAERDDQLRGQMLDAGGNRYSFGDWRTGASDGLVRAFRRYLTTPAGAAPAARAERLRRIGLARAAAASLGLPSGPQDVIGLETSGPVVVAQLVGALRATETDAAALAELGR